MHLMLMTNGWSIVLLSLRCTATHRRALTSCQRVHIHACHRVRGQRVVLARRAGKLLHPIHRPALGRPETNCAALTSSFPWTVRRAYKVHIITSIFHSLSSIGVYQRKRNEHPETRNKTRFLTPSFISYNSCPYSVVYVRYLKSISSSRGHDVSALSVPTWPSRLEKIYEIKDDQQTFRFLSFSSFFFFLFIFANLSSHFLFHLCVTLKSYLPSAK